MGDTYLHLVVKAQAERHASNPKVQNLSWSIVVAEAGEVMTKAEAYRTSVAGWKIPITFGVFWQEFLNIEFQLTSFKAKLTRYQRSLEDFDKDADAHSSSVLIMWRNKRDDISKGLRARCFSACVAKRLADHIMSTLDSEAPRAKVDPHTASTLPEGGSDALDILFKEPQQVMLSKNLENDCAVAAKTYFETNREKAINLSSSKVALCIEGGTNHSYHATDLPCFGWQTSDKFFNLADGITAYLHCIRQFCEDYREDVYPWYLQRCALQCVVGSFFFVVVVDFAMIRTVEGGFIQWLQNGHHTLLQYMPCYRLDPGDFLYVPFGSAPVILSVAYQQDGKLELPNIIKALESLECILGLSHFIG